MERYTSALTGRHRTLWEFSAAWGPALNKLPRLTAVGNEVSAACVGLEMRASQGINAALSAQQLQNPGFLSLIQTSFSLLAACFCFCLIVPEHLHLCFHFPVAVT